MRDGPKLDESAHRTNAAGSLKRVLPSELIYQEQAPKEEDIKIETAGNG